MKPIEHSLVSRLSERIGKLFCRKRRHPDLASEMMRIMPTAQLQTKRAEPQEELLLRFFREEPDEAIRHSLSDIARFSDDEMERYHDFIQWIFPTIRQSSVNLSAPVIGPQFVDKLLRDERAREGYCKGCRRYLHYMGLECDGYLAKESKPQEAEAETAAGPHITELPDGHPFWQLPSHNYLRITRMLSSLRQTGHPECSRKIYGTMMTILDRSPQHPITDATLGFWQRAQKSYQKDTDKTN